MDSTNWAGGWYNGFSSSDEARIVRGLIGRLAGWSEADAVQNGRCQNRIMRTARTKRTEHFQWSIRCCRHIKVNMYGFLYVLHARLVSTRVTYAGRISASSYVAV